MGTSRRKEILQIVSLPFLSGEHRCRDLRIVGGPGLLNYVVILSLYILICERGHRVDLATKGSEIILIPIMFFNFLCIIEKL